MCVMVTEEDSQGSSPGGDKSLLMLPCVTPHGPQARGYNSNSVGLRSKTSLNKYFVWGRHCLGNSVSLLRNFETEFGHEETRVCRTADDQNFKKMRRCLLIGFSLVYRRNGAFLCSVDNT